MTDCQIMDSPNTHTCSGNITPLGSGPIGSTQSGLMSGNMGNRTGATNNMLEDEFIGASRSSCGRCCKTYFKRRRGGDFYCQLAIATDEWSRKLFPLAFGLFNVFYWSYYTVWSREAEE